MIEIMSFIKIHYFHSETFKSIIFFNQRRSLMKLYGIRTKGQTGWKKVFQTVTLMSNVATLQQSNDFFVWFIELGFAQDFLVILSQVLPTQHG